MDMSQKSIYYKDVEIVYEPWYKEYYIRDLRESEYWYPTIKTLDDAKKRVDFLLKQTNP
jgi:hypothetical protein